MTIADKIQSKLDERPVPDDVWHWVDSEKLVGLTVGLRDELEHRLTSRAVNKAKQQADRDFNRLFGNMRQIKNFDLMLAVYFQVKRGKRTSIHSMRKWVDIHKDKTRDQLISMFEDSFQIGQAFDPFDTVAVYHAE